MTIIYTFIRYIISKEIIYISYCFMQLFSLGYIILYSGLYNESKFLQDIFLLFASLSAIVFSLSFYVDRLTPEITTTKELIKNTLLISIIISTAFYHYMLFEYLPYTIIYAILFISIVFNIKHGLKPNIIYVVGWSIICLLLFIFDFKYIYIQSGLIDIVLVAFAIEAILFTISISYKYADLQKQTKEYENLLLQQSRLAQSGEMIGNITHQFRQPLNNISYIIINIKKRFENNKLDISYFNKKTNQINEQLQFLSTTIDHFKDFYTPDKEIKNFSLNEAIDNSLAILDSEFKQRNIQLSCKYHINNNIPVYGIKNELSQVLLSILSNASDALKDIQSPTININIYSNKSDIVIDIINNGKLIKDKDMKKIFDQYYSTKHNGTGIGLYLSKLIIHRSFQGELKASNIDNKYVKFTIHLPKTI